MNAGPDRAGSSGRPWPPPAAPWIMFQQWRDLLFAHWKAPVSTLRSLVPAALALDLFEGEAWIAVTPFRMRGVRLRGLPPLPGVSRFPELNVRTYVTLGGKPGVYFFSLDAANPLAVAAARKVFGLPYHRARMSAEPFGEGIAYRSERSGSPAAAFEGWYAPASSAFRSLPGTLEHFLTERYCLYTAGADADVRRVEIDHHPWPLQRARAEIRRNTMARSAGVELDGDPLLHFAKRLDVRVWAPQRV
jgi:uncharacterized protein YqjF (DUF2071 family)